MTGRLLIAAALLATAWCARAETNLPSWSEVPARAAIVEFVGAVTREGSPDFVPEAERIAVFDNDGTLWSEQPLYFQLVFVLDEVKAAAAQHPEWKDNPAYQAVAANDREALAKLGHKPLLELVAVANSGMSVADYDESIRHWLATARHPRFQRPYTELVFKPMQELLDYLRAHGFTNWIVSGGGIAFMRAWAEDAYGIPPGQVVGSISEVKLEVRDGKPVLIRGPKVEFVDDGPGKPVGIYRAIGRRPIAAFGNSDGDLEMLQFTAAGEGRRLAVLVHHDDAEREYAYDRASHIGRLDKALDEARAKNWVVVSMKDDWKRIYPFEEPK
jgi:phosphoglycolate phosphatase-like HAD superfamily hydrolase